MFDHGQKVIVVKSSHRGKVGPKKGSIGYVLGSDSTRLIKRTVNKIPFCVESQVIVFVRYGFGKEREEPETRRILNVFPILSSYKPAPYRREAFRMFTEEVEGKSENVWPVVKWELKNKNNTPVCMLYPVENVEDIRDFNKVNFKAWYKSVVKSWTFSSNVDKTRPDFMRNKYEKNAREYFNAVRDSVKSRNFRDKVFAAVFSSDKVKSEVIYSMKYLHSMFEAALIKKYMKQISEAYNNNIYNDGPFLKHDAHYAALTSRIFNPAILNLQIELMKNRGLDYSRIEKGLKHTMRMIRENAQPLYSIKS